MTDDELKWYEHGYAHGESNQLNDWENALDGLLPDDVECRPTRVAAYIRRLQASVPRPTVPAGHQMMTTFELRRAVENGLIYFDPVADGDTGGPHSPSA